MNPVNQCLTWARLGQRVSQWQINNRKSPRFIIFLFFWLVKKGTRKIRPWLLLRRIYLISFWSMTACTHDPDWAHSRLDLDWVYLLMTITPQVTEGKDIPFRSRTAVMSRRSGTDGAAGSGSAPERGRADYGGLHLYQRQFSDGAVADAGCPQQSSFSCLQQVCCPAILVQF